MSELIVEPTGGVLGATVTGLDLRDRPGPETLAQLRAAWLKHRVLIFPEQKLDFSGLEQVTGYFGPLGDDPFFEAVNKETRVVAISRRADEQAPLFADNWHTDWSFKAIPPAGTLLYGVTIPPVGGDTSFINQQAAYAAMPEALQARVLELTALHSAAVAYAPEGTYGDREKGSDRSMRIRIDASARDVHAHAFVKAHPETGERMLYGTIGYIFGFEGVPQAEAEALLYEVYQWQLRPEFTYHHRWEPGMLVLWDNRAVLHKANGGFDGYDRLLYRTTVADDPAFYLSATAA